MEFDINYTHSQRRCTAGMQTRIHTLPRHLQFILENIAGQTGRGSSIPGPGRGISGTRPAGHEAPTGSPSAGTRHRQRRWEGAQAKGGCSRACRRAPWPVRGPAGACVRPASTPGPKPGVSPVPTPRLPDRGQLGRSPPRRPDSPRTSPGLPPKLRHPGASRPGGDEPGSPPPTAPSAPRPQCSAGPLPAPTRCRPRPSASAPVAPPPSRARAEPRAGRPRPPARRAPAPVLTRTWMRRGGRSRPQGRAGRAGLG